MQLYEPMGLWTKNNYSIVAAHVGVTCKKMKQVLWLNLHSENQIYTICLHSTRINTLTSL